MNRRCRLLELQGDWLWLLVRPARRGLAPLELALALPLLLMIMALMINFGTAAAWKVRAQVVARHAVWATRWPRDLSDLPRPTVSVEVAWPDIGTGQSRLRTDRWIAWPGSAGMGTAGGPWMASLMDPRIEHPVVRGPLPPANIDPDMYSLMTIPNGARTGQADIRRDYPLLQRTLGDYQLDARCPLLDNDWRYQRMPWDTEAWYWTGWHNEHRRIPVLYDLGFLAPQTDLLESLYQYPAYRNAFFAMARSFNWPMDFMAMGGPDLYGRDIRDDEDQFYENFFPRIYVDPQGMQHNIGFGRHHHRIGVSLRWFCSLDESFIRQRVDNLVDRIQGRPDQNGNLRGGVAVRVVRQYRNLYQAVLRRFQNPWPVDPPPAPGEMSALQQKIDAADRVLQNL
ncbi:MAG: hypothetical protein NZ602_16800 [Thermoguttaceae bacterium]|nr:hypothetical protein [Thermoguttaceae bacterium]MDW8038259.1 hypothetical protein [Thermoguttaceae bacterium]